MMKRQDGISLMEVLVTTLILGIGLLGVAALQLTSMNSNASGYMRSQASAIAEDVASKMRTAQLATFDGSTTVAQVITAYSGAPYTCGGAVTQCNATNCTPAQIAIFDRWEACKIAETQLPDGEIFVTNPGGIRTRIAVAWTPVAAREDLGQIDQILNVECATMHAGMTDKDCVILEVVP